MAAYDVTKVRKEKAGIGNNADEHIIGVIASSGTFSTNQQVVDSMKAGNTWQTSVPDEPKAKIKELRFCPHSACGRYRRYFARPRCHPHGFQRFVDWLATSERRKMASHAAVLH